METKGIRWDIAAIWGSLVWLLFSTGCTTFGIRFEKSQWEPLLQSPIGAIVLVPEKRLQLYEDLYRVLWIEKRETSYTFAGIWDPAPALGEQCTRTLQMDFDLRTVPLWREVEPGTYRELVAAAEAALIEEIRRGKAGGDATFSLGQYLKAQPSQDLRARFRHLGVDFLLELYVMGISVRRSFGSSGIVYVVVYGRLIRLADGEVLWLTRQLGSSGVADIAELARDNLAPLREAYDRAVVELCTVDRIFTDFRPN